MGLAESPKCGLCKSYLETIDHLFLNAREREIQREFYSYLVLPNLDIRNHPFWNSVLSGPTTNEKSYHFNV